MFFSYKQINISEGEMNLENRERRARESSRGGGYNQSMIYTHKTYGNVTMKSISLYNY
jgi:hypothetical protein